MLSPILTAVVLLILFLPSFVLSPLAEVLLSFRHVNKVVVRIVVNINCKEVEAQSISIRNRAGEETNDVVLQDFIADLQKAVRERQG